MNGSYNAATSTNVGGGSGDLKVATAGLGALSISSGTLNLEAAVAAATSLMEMGGR